MHTPFKQTDNSKKIELNSLKYNLDKYYEYSLRVGIVIILGCILKLIYTIEPKTLGKNSFITGIPYLRDYNLSSPLILNIILFIWSLILYTNPIIHNLMNNNISKYLYKNRASYIITNLSLLLFFYLLYFQLYIPLWYENEFRLSGHVLATLFSGSMLCNLINFCENYETSNIKKQFMRWVINICKFLLYHNLYVIVWTVWVYHETREAVLSYVISLIYTLTINYLSLDRVVLSIFYDKNEFMNNRVKQRDIVFGITTERYDN
jgi:hypothetical protein